jgi:colicin import membrane protein
MAAYIYETPNEKAISGALALVMHAVFFAMLMLSVSWQRHEPAAMMAELWSNLPAPTSEVPPPPPPKVEPAPPKPTPKVEPKPEPRVEPKPEPKADIDLREKKEKERRETERKEQERQELAEKKKQQQEELAEKKKKQQQELAEKKKREAREKAEALKVQQAKEATEAKRKAQEQADALKKLAQEQAAGQAREIDKYKAAIQQRIKRFIVEPANLQGNPEVEIDVVVLPGGEVLDVRTRKGSGQTIWDNAVERAIRKAQPLPLPPADSPIFSQFRELHLKFRPKE